MIDFEILQTFFRDFDEAISLGTNTKKRVRRSFKTLSKYLRRQDGITSCTVQGSFGNHTAIEPQDGDDYDLDIIVRGDWETGADAALDDLESLIAEHGVYGGKLDEAKHASCIRVIYADDNAGGFHVDLVPAREPDPENYDEDKLPPLEIPRRDRGWNPSAPADFSEWSKRLGDDYAQTVRTLKRWRDLSQGTRSSIKSILLQVLVANHLGASVLASERLEQTLAGIHNYLAFYSSPPEIPNPVYVHENLAERWTDAAFLDFKLKVGEALALIEKANQAADTEEAVEVWKELLGTDFPDSTAEADAIERESIDHARTASAESWTVEVNGVYDLRVRGELERSGSKRMQAFESRGRLLPAGIWLRFELDGHDSLPHGTEIWWQVANTGRHATQEDSLRGEFLRAKARGWPSHGKDRSDSTQPHVHWEQTAYTGSHVIKAVAVKNQVVIAQSEWFDVRIFNPSFSSFRRKARRR